MSGMKMNVKEDSDNTDLSSESVSLESSFRVNKDNGRKYKILFVTAISGFLSQFEAGDVELAQEMGYEIHFASNFNNPIYEIPEDYFKKNGIICHQVDITKSPYHFVNNNRIINEIRRVIDDYQIDIVHCHNPMGGVAARLAAKKSKVKPYVIYTAHGLHFYKGAPFFNWMVYYPVEKYLARYTDTLVAINSEDYTFLTENFKLRDGGKFELIHGVGFDTVKFSARRELNEAKRRELGIPLDAFHIVTAAELNSNKNQSVIIEAISQINNKKIYYSLCGKGQNEEKLLILISKKGLSDRVKLMGFRTDMEDVLQTADAFAFPSIREGLGMAAIEALACDVPLIVSDNRGTREYAVNGSNGIVCDAHDVHGFRDAIDKIVNDSEFYHELKKNCRNKAMAFSRENTKSIMREVYIRADKSVRER